MEKILCEMDEFQKGIKNVHKPLKDWIAKLVVLTAKVSPMKKQLRSTCEKISEEVGRMHHIAAKHAKMS
jgi:ribosomal protein L7Ae-like RNA K-turn-binding protein